MHLVERRSGNRIALPGEVVALAGPGEGDFLNALADGTRIVTTAQEIRERGAGYTGAGQGRFVMARSPVAVSGSIPVRSS